MTPPHKPQPLPKLYSDLLKSTIILCGTAGAVCVLWYWLEMPGILIAAFFAVLSGMNIYNAWQGIQTEREYIAAFKQQTRSIFIGSRGDAENFENDKYINARRDLAFHYLKVSGNPHRLKVYVSFFRDVAVIVYHMDKNGNVAKTETAMREATIPLPSAETREQYAHFWKGYQGRVLNEDLIKARMNQNAAEWVAANWFSQQVEAGDLL